MRLRVDVDGQVSAELRSHRRDRQLLLRLAVVPEARRVRSRRLDRAPVLRQLGVLRRLRQLRRPHDGADGLDRRRDRRRAVAHRRGRARRRIATRRTTCTTSRGRRARTSSRSGSSSSMPGRAPVQMRLLIQPEHEHLADRHFAAAAAALQYYGEWYGAVSVSDADHRRSGVPERLGRHGVPDDLHRRARAGCRRATATIPNTSSCTRPATSSGTAWSPTTRSSSRGWTKASTSTPTRACSAMALQPNYLVQRFFGDFIPWQYRDIPLKRATDTNWMNTYRRAPDRDSISTPTASLWPGTHQNMSYHKAALMLHTLERMLHVGGDAAGAVDLLRALASSSIRSREDFFAVLERGHRQGPHSGSSTRSIAARTRSTTRSTGWRSEPIGARGLMEAAEGTDDARLEVPGDQGRGPVPDDGGGAAARGRASSRSTCW